MCAKILYLRGPKDDIKHNKTTKTIPEALKECRRRILSTSEFVFVLRLRQSYSKSDVAWHSQMFFCGPGSIMGRGIYFEKLRIIL